MKSKVFKIASEYSEKIAQFENIETIILSEIADKELSDPNFIIALDVYYSRRLISASRRRKLFANSEILEASSGYPVDRFMVENLPVIIRYRSTHGIDRIFNRIEKAEWVFRMESSNILYRLKEGHVFFDRNGWIEKIKQRYNIIPDEFWLNIIDSSSFFIEHYLREMNVSIFKNNNLLYQLTLTNFIKCVCSYIFALNRKFEPSARLLYSAIEELPNLPDEFLSRFNLLIAPARNFALDREGEIATLITKSLLNMKLE